MNKGYAICLNEWLYDDDLIKKGLLPIILMISSLTAKNGYCYAGNDYFTEKLNVSEVTVSRKIRLLIDLGYVEAIYKKQGALIVSRELRLTQMIKTINTDDKNDYHTRQKRLTSVTKTINIDVKENNTCINNTIINNIATSFSEDVLESYNFILNFFPSHLQPKNEKQKKGWLETLDKLKRIDKIDLKIVECIVKKVREDDFWSKNFLSLTKLRKKNKEGIMYIVVFSEKFKNNESVKESIIKNSTGW